MSSRLFQRYFGAFHAEILVPRPVGGKCGGPCHRRPGASVAIGFGHYGRTPMPVRANCSPNLEKNAGCANFSAEKHGDRGATARAGAGHAWQHPVLADCCLPEPPLGERPQPHPSASARGRPRCPPRRPGHELEFSGEAFSMVRTILGFSFLPLSSVLPAARCAVPRTIIAARCMPRAGRPVARRPEPDRSWQARDAVDAKRPAAPISVRSMS